jgi:hypothetical protein
MDVLRPPTYKAFTEALVLAKKEGRPYRFVHFDGHGAYRASPFNPALKRGYLIFEGQGEEAEYVDGRAVGQVLQANGIQALLLNACRSGFAAGAQPHAQAPAKGTPFESLAEEVVNAGVISVLAMGFDVYVSIAASLIADTYGGMAAGRNLGEAVLCARRQLLA